MCYYSAWRKIPPFLPTTLDYILLGKLSIMGESPQVILNPFAPNRVSF